jgi:hypothetical protein
MRNVWLDLPSRSPYILDIDCDGIIKLGPRAVGATKINVESIPELRSRLTD